MRKVVVILPTFNEKANIRKFAEEVLAQEKNLPGWRIEVLIVDSRSPDGTGEIAQNLTKENPRIHFLNVGRGLGVALIEGHTYSLNHLKPDVLAQLDADGQVEVDIVPRLVKVIEEGYDLAIGSRFVPGGKNKLSLSRKIFSAGSSFVCRFIMGPWDIKEFGNSARAFTPKLFNKINLERLPWREKTFIIQPAFLNEAILAGANYKEIPLVFKNRAEGYSKNKVINYTYDVFTYAIDARLHKWGINFSFFKATRRAKTLIKFGLVGFTGTFVDFLFYKLFIWYLGMPPATSKGFSTEVAIINNFTLNNIWTFRHRKTSKNIFQRFLSFQMVSLVGLGIAVGIVKGLDLMFGSGYIDLGFRKLAYNNFYFFATIPPVMIWNFVVNHYFTWKHEEEVIT
ncbi:GtrA family protein [Candidatus Daviesbacteria bacterium]|nr:GtrA family protein [Candidatus Daviesbacteria bacterium]